MQSYRIIILLILTTLPFFSFAQEKWSLERCINYALENNIQIKQQELNAKMTKNNLLQSKMNTLPNVNLGMNRYYSFGRRVDPFTNEFSNQNTVSDNYSLSGSMTLFNGFQTINTIRQNQYSYLSGMQNVDKMKNDISLNIANAYLQILYSQELLTIAENQLSVTRSQSERLSKLVQAGSLAKVSLLEIESQVASEELQVVNMQNQLDMSRLSLAQILDLDTVETFRIEMQALPDPESLMIIPPASQIFNDAMTKMPQVKSAEYDLKSSERGLAVARGSRSPRISLNGSFGTGYSDAMKSYAINGIDTLIMPTGFTSGGDIVYTPTLKYNQTETLRPYRDQLDYNISKTISLNVNIPIFNNWQSNTSISNAKISVLNSRYSLDLTRSQLFKDIQQSRADASAAMNKYLASKKSVSALQESFDYSQLKFDGGSMNSVDYNISKNNLLKAKSDLLQAKYEYVFKLKILDFYRGIPIKL